MFSLGIRRATSASQPTENCFTVSMRYTHYIFCRAIDTMYAAVAVATTAAADILIYVYILLLYRCVMFQSVSGTIYFTSLFLFFIFVFAHVCTSRNPFSISSHSLSLCMFIPYARTTSSKDTISLMLTHITQHTAHIHFKFLKPFTHIYTCILFCLNIE